MGCPQNIEILELPRTTTGKLQRVCFGIIYSTKAILMILRRMIHWSNLTARMCFGHKRRLTVKDGTIFTILCGTMLLQKRLPPASKNY